MEQIQLKGRLAFTQKLEEEISELRKRNNELSTKLMLLETQHSELSGARHDKGNEDKLILQLNQKNKIILGLE